MTGIVRKVPEPESLFGNRSKLRYCRTMNRRQLIIGTAAAAATTLAASTRASAEPSAPVELEPRGDKPARPNRIGVSTYSFWRYRPDSKISIERCIDLAADMGFDGVELLQKQMPRHDNAYLQAVKRRAFVQGLDLMGYSTHQGFVSPDKESRQHNIDHTIDCIEQAYALGIPTMRVNTGTWGTSKDFDELMANKGIEKRLEGYSDDDGFKWVIDSLAECVPAAEKCGVILGLENHWGLGRTAAGVMRVVEAIDSPWLRCTLDTGNFLEDNVAQYKVMAPHAVLVQAKTYFGGGTWYTLDLDYAEIAGILKAANYTGYISLEYEGKDPAESAIPASLERLRAAFA